MKGLPRPLLVLFIALAFLTLYAPTLAGDALWDDHRFIFSRMAFPEGFRHGEVWKFHIWPLFDSLATLLHGALGPVPQRWRLLSLVLHALNAWLCARLVRRWRPDWALPLATLFLLHPLAMLTVAWIIQLKTLLCACFLLLALEAALLWEEKKRPAHYALAALAFFASITTKSASLPAPWLVLALLFRSKRLDKRHTLALLPFLALTVWSVHRITSNQWVEARIEHADQKLFSSAPETADAPVELPELPEFPTSPDLPVDPVATPDLATVEVTPPHRPMPSPSRASLVVHTLGTYLSWPYWPWPLSPVHGPYEGGFTLRAVAGLALLGMCLAWGWKRRVVAWLALAQLALLAPFLGMVAAPYLTYTAVSEQHLYLALPLALALQFVLAERCLPNWRSGLYAAALLAAMALGLDYAPSFRDDEAFFGRVLERRPADVMAHLNLAAYYQRMGQPARARAVARRGLELTKDRPETPFRRELERSLESGAP